MTGAIQLGRILAGESHAPVVYFIAMTYGGRPAVKIGTSTRLKVRIRSVSYAAETTDVLLLMPGGESIETLLHAKFRKYQIPPFAELFWLEGGLRDFIAQPALPQLPLTVRLRRRWWSRSVAPAPEPELEPVPAPAPEPESAPEPPPELEPEIEPDPVIPELEEPLVTLRQAVDGGVLKVGGRDPLGAARKAAQRPGFPEIRGWDGPAALYYRSELREWQDGKVRVLR